MALVRDKQQYGNLFSGNLNGVRVKVIIPQGREKAGKKVYKTLKRDGAIISKQVSQRGRWGKIYFKRKYIAHAEYIIKLVSSLIKLEIDIMDPHIEDKNEIDVVIWAG